MNRFSLLVKWPYLKLLQILLCLVISGHALAQTDSTSVDDSTVTTLKKKSYTGMASFYSDKFNGRKTASGEIFSQKKLTCACNILPIGTRIKVTCIKTKKSVIVKVNDRLHHANKRIVDLTKAAAAQLGFMSTGLTKVKIDVIKKK